MWDPLVFVFLAALLMVFVYLFSLMFNKSYSKGVQEEPFVSGHAMSPSMHVNGTGLYWGFTHALKGYYHQMWNMHSDDVTDYVYWFTVVLAVVFIMLLGVGM
jgi:hypothetical protein